jgi:hypothetical protein
MAAGPEPQKSPSPLWGRVRVGGHSPADAAPQNRHDRSDASISTFHQTSAILPPSRVNVCHAKRRPVPKLCKAG